MICKGSFGYAPVGILFRQHLPEQPVLFGGFFDERSPLHALFFQQRFHTRGRYGFGQVPEWMLRYDRIVIRQHLRMFGKIDERIRRGGTPYRPVGEYDHFGASSIPYHGKTAGMVLCAFRIFGQGRCENSRYLGGSCSSD